MTTLQHLHPHLEQAERDEAAWLAQARAHQPLSPAMALTRLQGSLRIARLAWGVGEPGKSIEALICASRWGRVLAMIDRPDAATLQWQDAEGAWQLACTLSPLNAPLAIQAVAAASLCDDRAAMKAGLRRGFFDRLVRDARRVDAVVGGESFWALLGELFAAAIAGEHPAPAAFANCRAAFDHPDTRGSAFDPVARDQLLRPLLDCLQALSGNDAGAWQAALTRALQSHHSYFDAAERAGLLLGPLAIELSALAKLAATRGWASVNEEALFTAVIEPLKSVELERVYPLRTARDAREAHWQLDLDGAPRTHRTHALLQKDGGLATDYSIADGSGTDRWRAAFALRDDAPGLDAGELLAVSDVLADRVDTTPPGDPQTRRAQRILLQEAIDALDALLARYPAGATTLPDSAFFTERGRAIRADDPARFDIERLRAIRGAYTKLQNELAEKHTNESAKPSSEDEARLVAGVAAEALKQQLTPLLLALGQDQDGRLAAQLRPRADDYEKAFLPPYVDAARSAFEAIWAESPRIQAAQPGSQLKLHVAPAGMLADDNDLSWHFPGGYRSIAPLLNPHRVWAAWKLIPPGKDAGMAYDGLVWLDDHWTWFPKPYRALAALVRPRATGSS